MKPPFPQAFVAVLASAAALAYASAVFTAWIAIPVVVPGPYAMIAHGTTSLWALMPGVCSLGAFALVAASVAPLITRRNDRWVIPLVAATVLLTLAAMMWVGWFRSQEEPSGALVSLSLFTIAGAMLIAQTVVVRTAIQQAGT